MYTDNSVLSVTILYQSIFVKCEIIKYAMRKEHSRIVASPTFTTQIIRQQLHKASFITKHSLKGNQNISGN